MDKYIILYFVLILLIIILRRDYSINYSKNTKKSSDYFLPKIIWTHWDDMDKAPMLIKNILKQRDNILKDWEIHILNDSNIDTYINRSRYPKNYNDLMPSQKSDWIRLYLLKEHGGVWLDAGIIINDNTEFNKIYNDSVEYKSELTGFYLNGSIINDDPLTFIESWFIMAPINSKIINKWFYEFEYAVNVDFFNYKTQIMNQGVEVDKIYMFGEHDTYLTIHATLQKLLQLRELSKSKILLYKAEDTMFKLHIDCKWDSNCIKNKISTENIRHIPFIKLRGSDRGDGNYILL